MTQIDRSKLVIVFYDPKTNEIHCNVCKDYYGDIHGQCPCTSGQIAKTCGSNASARPHPPGFNNIQYIPIAIQGYQCKGRQYRFCGVHDCNACVIVKRKQVLRGDNQWI